MPCAATSVDSGWPAAGAAGTGAARAEANRCRRAGAAGLRLTDAAAGLIAGRPKPRREPSCSPSAAAEACARAAELSPRPKNRATANADEPPARKNLFKSVSNSAAGCPASRAGFMRSLAMVTCASVLPRDPASPSWGALDPLAHQNCCTAHNAKRPPRKRSTTSRALAAVGVRNLLKRLSFYAATFAREARLRSCGSRWRLRRRIDFGVTSTSSSSSM